MAEIDPPCDPHPDAEPEKTVNNAEDSETRALVDEKLPKAPHTGLTQRGELVMPIPSVSQSLKLLIQNEPTHRCAAHKTKGTRKVYEAWKVSRFQAPQAATRYLVLGILPLIVKERYHYPAIKNTPENFYSQAELKRMYFEARTEHLYVEPENTWESTRISSYEDKLERRVKDLDVWDQRALENLVQIRTNANSNEVYRRDYKIVHLREVPGGESLTDVVPTSRPTKYRKTWYRPWGWEQPRNTDYHIILEGTEVKEANTRWVWNEETTMSRLWASSRYRIPSMPSIPE